MPENSPQYLVKLAESEVELRAAQGLRYEVFIRELGGSGPLVDHEQGLEIDQAIARRAILQ